MPVRMCSVFPGIRLIPIWIDRWRYPLKPYNLRCLFVSCPYIKAKATVHKANSMLGRWFPALMEADPVLWAIGVRDRKW